MESALVNFLSVKTDFGMQCPYAGLFDAPVQEAGEKAFQRVPEEHDLLPVRIILPLRMANSPLSLVVQSANHVSHHRAPNLLDRTEFKVVRLEDVPPTPKSRARSGGVTQHGHKPPRYCCAVAKPRQRSSQATLHGHVGWTGVDLTVGDVVCAPYDALNDITAVPIVEHKIVQDHMSLCGEEHQRNESIRSNCAETGRDASHQTHHILKAGRTNVPDKTAWVGWAARRHHQSTAALAVLQRSWEIAKRSRAEGCCCKNLDRYASK